MKNLEMFNHVETSLNSLSVQKLLDLCRPYFACLCLAMLSLLCLPLLTLAYICFYLTGLYYLLGLAKGPYYWALLGLTWAYWAILVLTTPYGAYWRSYLALLGLTGP